ncbi:unnamed protein product [Acanthoscelides obtectus]|uniref:Uncharacterized protein n=1 Tax=Acanthoscelides obtectus TaxID=200917 RepID=A0A9P0LMG6_ACAOB|nr:unnamed protein product [Acanthoscelides obtectus]CAK1670955.1 hypothetical protein AOBTE_LOCUS27943 [Acanthoscelides obtectus]
MRTQNLQTSDVCCCAQVVLAAIIALLSLIDNFQRQRDVGSAFFVELAVKKLRQPSTGFLVIRKNKKNGALSSILT